VSRIIFRRRGATRCVHAFTSFAVLGLLLLPSTPLAAQVPGTENGAWRYLGGDAWHTRFQPSVQVDTSSFESLGVAWEWSGSGTVPASELRDLP